MIGKTIKKIDKYLESDNLSKEEKIRLLEIKRELEITKEQSRIIYLISLLIKIITGLSDD
jgi:hypothetical protein